MRDPMAKHENRHGVGTAHLHEANWARTDRFNLVNQALGNGRVTVLLYMGDAHDGPL